jgi:hypothetical protein
MIREDLEANVWKSRREESKDCPSQVGCNVTDEVSEMLMSYNRQSKWHALRDLMGLQPAGRGDMYMEQ